MERYDNKFEDYLGKRFGKLKVVELLPREVDENGLLLKVDGKKYAQLVKYVCVCDCGNRTVVSRNSLRDGITKSCGCLKVGRPLGRKNCAYKQGLRNLGCAMKDLPCNKMIRMCCWDCDGYEKCSIACVNNPSKCGYYKG